MSTVAIVLITVGAPAVGSLLMGFATTFLGSRKET